MDNYAKYLEVMNQEILLIKPSHLIPQVTDRMYMFNLAHRIIEVAKNSTVLRCGGGAGHLTEDTIAYESVGAHTNLARAITSWVLDAIYGWDNSSPNYSRRIFDEVMLLHDLPENDFGDIPDNGSRNDNIKAAAEEIYHSVFSRYYPEEGIAHHQKVLQLLKEMNNRSTSDGKILYLADKLSAIIMELCYEYIGIYPYASPNDANISKNNRTEMRLCDNYYKNGYLLSEMWTIDFLVIRELTQYDETGIFTALLVMITLIVHEEWYDWREEQYLNL